MLNIESVEYSRKFLKKLSHLPARLIDKAQERERIFKVRPFDPSLDTHKLHGRDKDCWSFSIDRKYRIKFAFLTDGYVLFLDVGTHDMYN